jgi:hypothetical protein
MSSISMFKILGIKKSHTCWGMGSWIFVLVDTLLDEVDGMLGNSALSTIRVNLKTPCPYSGLWELL